MTEGSGLIPPGGGGTVERAGTGNGGGRSAQIISLPDALETVVRARRLEGEVVRQTEDGRVRIRTAEGDVEIQVRNPHNAPQPGQRVSIDIPPGRPPQQAVLRSLPQQIQQDQTPRAQTSQTQTAQSAPSVQRPVSLPPLPRTVTPSPVAPGTQSSQISRTQQAPLQPGDAVRLLSLPALPSSSAPLPIPDIVSAGPARAAFAANLIAQISTEALQNAFIISPVRGVSGATVPVPPSLMQPSAFPAQGFAGSGAVSHTPAVSRTPVLSFLSSIPQANGLLPVPEGTEVSRAALSTSFVLPQPSRPAGMDVQVLRILPPEFPLTAPGASSRIVSSSFLSPVSSVVNISQAGAMIAQVTGTSAEGLPVLSLRGSGTMAAQAFVLQFSADNLMPGTRIEIVPVRVITPQGVPAGALLPQGGETSALAPFLQGWTWPVLEEMYQALAQNAPQAAQALARTLPGPASPAQLGAAAMLFVAAVRSGDIGGWLGERGLDALRRIGASGVLERAGREMTALNRLAAEPVSGEWRAHPLPLFWDGTVHKIMLYTKHDENRKNDTDSDEKQVRFIFDLNLNRMGDVQLDGLVRGRRLDMAVRTGVPLSVSMQQAMRGTYVRALEETGLRGELTFQGDPRHRVQVLRPVESVGVSA